MSKNDVINFVGDAMCVVSCHMQRPDAKSVHSASESAEGAQSLQWPW